MKLILPTWRTENGEIIACTEKIKVMQENIAELQQVLQDAYEDALLMDIDAQQIKHFMHTLIEQLQNPYKEQHV